MSYQSWHETTLLHFIVTSIWGESDSDTLAAEWQCASRDVSKQCEGEDFYKYVTWEYNCEDFQKNEEEGIDI